MRVPSLLSAALLLSLSIPAPAQEAVGASRYRERLAGSSDVGKVLEQTPFEDRCRHDDGGTVDTTAAFSVHLLIDVSSSACVLTVID
jgi:hypothetical protein